MCCACSQPRERRVIQLRFGLGDGHQRALDEVARDAWGRAARRCASSSARRSRNCAARATRDEAAPLRLDLAAGPLPRGVSAARRRKPRVASRRPRRRRRRPTRSVNSCTWLRGEATQTFVKRGLSAPAREHDVPLTQCFLRVKAAKLIRT